MHFQFRKQGRIIRKTYQKLFAQQKEQANGPKWQKPAIACAAVLFITVLLILGVRSIPGHEEPIQTASTHSESSTDTVNDESPASNQSVSTENEVYAGTDDDDSPASEVSNQSVSSESESINIINEDADPVLKSPVQSVSLGFRHSAAISKNGGLWTWGSGSFGKSGSGKNTIFCHEPVKIMDDVQSVSLGYSHSAAIKTDGSLWLWGLNSSYQLGDGSKVDHLLLPVCIVE